MAVEYVIFVLAVVLFIVFIVIWSLHFISLTYGKYKFHKRTKRTIEKDKLPAVSIIKPLMGIDDNLRTNLETFFVMDYPVYEILFCVQDSNDPVISLVRELMAKYPDVDAKLFSGGKVVGINPKINNMMQGYVQIKNDFFLISDAGLKMAKDTLYDMVSLMREKVGLVHQMPFVCDRSGFAGALEKVYFGTCHCRMYLFINLIGINCVTGMSCLMRKKVIDEAGGLQKFGNYIAEDYFLAKEFIDRNWKIQVSHQPAMQNSANYSVSTWQKRMIRWCKLRLKLSVMSWLEPMQECFMLGVCTSWTVAYLFGWSSLVFFMVHVLCWFICDYMLLKVVQNGKLPFSKFEYIIAWLYREGICFYLFLKAVSNPTVKWRDGTYRLRWGGLAEEIVPNEAKNKKAKTPKVAKNLANSSSTNKLLNGKGTSNKDVDEDDDDENEETIESQMKSIPNGGGQASAVAPPTVTLSSSQSSLTTPSITLNMNGQPGGLATAKVAKAPLLNHKRTNSFTAMINNNQHQNNTNSNYLLSSNSNNLNGKLTSEMETSSSLLSAAGTNLSRTTANQPFKPSFNHSRSHHQHHHSISTPIQQQQQQQQSLHPFTSSHTNNNNINTNTSTTSNSTSSSGANNNNNNSSNSSQLNDSISKIK